MNTTVNIKMYKVGELGDCFLLRFTNGTEKSHVLIDCGSFRNGKDSVERMNLIADDIKLRLGTDKLNVVVGTHQHNDHLSGFVHAQKKFEKIAPDQVWLSWLDNPDSKQARQIGEDYNNYLNNLRLIGKQLKTSQFAASKVSSRVNEILGFWGITGNERINAKTDKLPPDLPAKAIEILRKLGKKKPAYLEPGDVFNLPGIRNGAVKVYVLGPPKNEDLLYDKDPNSDETFDPKLAAKSANTQRLLHAIKQLNGTAKKSKDDEPYPFDEPYYDSGNFGPVENSYYSPKNKWRQIELDWLNQAEQLALWLDDFTNNSSLVLAFELVKTKKVLLFVADAQTGNWLSWKEIKWKRMPKEFNWLTLMRNTVLYKAGHHGSHNSTLPEGLNNMLHEELVVMIPVDKTDGNIKKKNGWRMPAEILYKELKKRSKYRIIRMDDGISNAKAWDELPSKPLGKKETLYWEYEIKG